MLQNEVPDAVNLAAAEAAHTAGARIMLDAAPAKVLPAALVELVDILVVDRVKQVR